MTAPPPSGTEQAVPREEMLERHLALMKSCASDIISVKPVEEVLMKVVELMVRKAGADHATITLRDEQNDEFVVKHEFPPRDDVTVVGARFPIAGYPVQEAIVRHKKRVVIPDLASHDIVKESQKVADLNRHLGTKSMVILPMVCRDHVIGTISADSFTQRRFLPEELDMYESVANQATVAIDNSRLLEDARTLKKLYADAYSAVNLERVAAAILQGLLKIVGCEKASVQLIRDEDRRVLLAAHGFSKERASQRLLGPVKYDRVVKSIASTLKMRVIPDTEQDPEWQVAPETEHVRSWVGIPLVVTQHPVGLITMDHSAPGFYARLANPLDETRIKLERFAARVAFELQEAYAFDAAQHHLQTLMLIDTVAEIVGRSLDTVSLLKEVTREIGKCLPCDRCVAFLLEKEGNTRRLVGKASWPESDAALPSFVVPQDLKRPISPTVEAFLEGKSVKVENFDAMTADQHLATEELADAGGSAISIPILSGKLVVGVLTASRIKTDGFSDTNQTLLETLVRHTGVAVARNSGLALVEDVGKKMLSATNMEKLLEEIASGAIRLTNTDSGIIFTLNDDGTAVLKRYSPPGRVHPEPRLTNENGMTRRVIRDRKILQIADISQCEYDVNPDLKGLFKSMFALPLTLTVKDDGNTDSTSERVVGVLYLNGVQARVMSDTELAFVTTLANQAAIVVQRTRLHEQILESEALYHSLVDNIPQRVFRKDRKSHFTSANKSFCESLGREEKDVIGKTDYDFYPREMADAFVADDQRVMLEKKTISKAEEHHAIGQPGPNWVQVVKTPVKDVRNEPIGVQAIFWDVTEEKLLRDKYEALIEQSPDSIVLHAHGVITMANPAAAELFGVSSEKELEGRSIFDFVHPDDLPLARERHQRLTNREDVPPAELRVLSGGKRVTDVRVYAKPLPGKNEVQVVFHNMNRVNNLLKEMHHRVRKALDVVSGQLSDEERENPGETVVRVFRALRGRITAISNLHQMLQLQRGGKVIRLENYLRALSDEVLNAYESRCSLTCRVEAGDVRCDESYALWLGLIVTELVANAALHGFKERREGHIDVRLTGEPSHYTLVVEDDGDGGGALPQPSTDISGLRVVDDLVHDSLSGNLTMRARHPRGTIVTIEFAMPPAETMHGR